MLVACAGAAAADFGWQRLRPGTPPPEISLAPASPWSAAMTVPDRTALARRPFHQEIVKAAQRAGIDPALVHAVIRVESAYNAGAVSPKGATGLMQVIPGTGRRFGVENLLQPGANISAGTQYLSYLMRMFKGDLSLALAAYNAGENAVVRYGNRIPPYRETQGYVPRVMKIYEALAAMPPPVNESKPAELVEAVLSGK
ncbi:MAG TPA: lytic transglycosylase domain-containing protein [Burkholderiales bacterium]|nr:lytic transglycosylase domain-containing protein [Burkholderiales bacterium]